MYIIHIYIQYMYIYRRANIIISQKVAAYGQFVLVFLLDKFDIEKQFKALFDFGSCVKLMLILIK